MHITRRHALAMTSAFVPVALLAACAGTPASLLAVYAKTVANAAQAVLATLPPGTVVPAVVTSSVTTLQSLATQVAANPATGTGSPVQQFVLATEEALPLLAQFAATFGVDGQGASVALAAIGAVLPFIAQAAGMATQAAAMPGQRMTAAEAVVLFGPK